MKSFFKSFIKGLIYVIICMLFFSYPIFSDQIDNNFIKYLGELTINSNSFESDSYLIQDKLYVPLRELADELGAEISFDPITNNINYSSVRDMPESDPLIGEEFVYGEIESISFDSKQVIIKQHYDDNSYNVTKPLRVIDDAIIILQRNDNQINLDFKDLKIGDIVGMILNENKDIRGIIIDL